MYTQHGTEANDAMTQRVLNMKERLDNSIGRELEDEDVITFWSPKTTEIGGNTSLT